MKEMFSAPIMRTAILACYITCSLYACGSGDPDPLTEACKYIKPVLDDVLVGQEITLRLELEGSYMYGKLPSWEVIFTPESGGTGRDVTYDDDILKPRSGHKVTFKANLPGYYSIIATVGQNEVAIDITAVKPE